VSVKINSCEIRVLKKRVGAGNRNRVFCSEKFDGEASVEDNICMTCVPEKGELGMRLGVCVGIKVAGVLNI
jgi:hypothetical protein